MNGDAPRAPHDGADHSPLSRQKARAHAEALKEDLAVVLRDVLAVREGKDWLVLGHPTWDSFRRSERLDLIVGQVMSSVTSS
jgi:hypothetical protein